MVAFDGEGMKLEAAKGLDMRWRRGIHSRQMVVRAWGSHVGARMLAAQCEMWYIDARKAAASRRAAFFEHVLSRWPF